MTPDEFKQSAHQEALRKFLETPCGVEFMRLLEARARPSGEALRQFGGAEDIKLQMSLNFVSLHQNFQTLEFIRGLSHPKTDKKPQKRVLDFIPEDATPEFLKEMGVPLPEKPQKPEPVAS